MAMTVADPRRTGWIDRHHGGELLGVSWHKGLIRAHDRWISIKTVEKDNSRLDHSPSSGTLDVQVSNLRPEHENGEDRLSFHVSRPFNRRDD